MTKGRRKKTASGAVGWGGGYSARIAVDGLVCAKALEFGHGAVQLERDLPGMIGVHVDLPDGGLWHAVQGVQAQRLCVRVGLKVLECFQGSKQFNV